MLGLLRVIARVDKCDARIGIETRIIRRTFHRWMHSSLSRILRQTHRPFLPRSNSTALLNLFFVASPPIFLFRDLPTFQRCGSRVDCCQMLPLSDLSPAHSPSLSPNKAKVRFDTLLFDDARFVADALSIEWVFLIAIMSDFTDSRIS